MLESKHTQFMLSPEGKILWQEKMNNPLPGIPVAALSRGEHPLRPKIEILSTPQTEGLDPQKIRDVLALWWVHHIQSVLEPLALLGNKPSAPPSPLAEPPVSPAPEGTTVSISETVFDVPVLTSVLPSPSHDAVLQAVYDSLGIIQRQTIESHITKLTPEDRVSLRRYKIRLGPILVFIPALNKPAAVKLRAVLFSLYHGLPLPARVPTDGIVSQKIEDTTGMEAFFRSIGYPLYGGRAVRIDMLDRVISTIYDHAKDGIFQARHEMAEWLGTPIEDLYRILEDMGHKRIEEPASLEEHAFLAVPEAILEPQPEAPQEQVVLTEEAKNAQAVISDIKKPAVVKPPLAKFRLKRGKASKSSHLPSREKRAYNPSRDPSGVSVQSTDKDIKGGRSKSKDDKKGDHPKEGYKKRDHKKQDQKNQERPDFKGREFKGKDKFKKHDNPRAEQRVVMLESKKRAEDSPFAVLQNLIVKKDA